MRRFLIACCAAAAGAYTTVRLVQSLRSRREAPPPLERDPAAYGRYRRGRMVGELVLGLGRQYAFVFGGGAARLARRTRTGRPLVDAALSSAAMLALSAVVDLPGEHAGGLVVERRYGLSAQSDGAWLADHAKGLGVMLAIAPPLASLFTLAARKAPRAWPWLVSGAIFPLAMLANVVGPLYLAPLFNRYEPLEGPLTERLRALAERVGVPSAAIFRVDMSRQTEKANAFVTGLFGVHRVVLGDTLLAHFSDDEIVWVVAHELGHYVRRDTWKMVAISQAAGTLVVFAAKALAERAIARDADGDLGVSALDEPAALPLLLLEATLASTLIGPAVAAISREIEWAADRFARAALPDGDAAGASALRRLRDRNLAEDEQPRWAELLFATHPSLRARVEALERPAKA